MFGVVDRLLLSPPSNAPAPDRLARIVFDRTYKFYGRSESPLTNWPTYHRLAAATSFSGVAAYNELVNLCIQLKDNGTHKLALEILHDSEEHVDWLETQLSIIGTIGLEKYLAEHLFDGDDD